ncbi:MAG: class I SAM-dependent methyltransferase [Alphaproteobacteria bacterium]|nr:class I SAM-dependent methyltransferase [Alphaproteobacteria bacterium]
MRRPRFIAEQARNATGILGRIVAFIMARETREANRRAIASLDVKITDHVLDIGCGPGHGLEMFAARVSEGLVAGVDPSELMVEVAVQRNAAAVRAGRVRVAIAPAEHLPFAEASFDKVLCVHAVYFWHDLRAALGEIARVTKPGGTLALLFRDAADKDAINAFPSEVYRFPEFASVVAALGDAAFEVTTGSATAKVTPSSQQPRLIVAKRRAP